MEGGGGENGSLSGRRVALIATGAFNPPHFAHLRIFERARDYLERVQGAHVVVGYMSTVADAAEIAELAPAKHRVRMIEIALKKNDWIRTGSWESQQSRQPSLQETLRHYEKEVQNDHGEDTMLVLLCGGDFLEAEPESDRLLNYGLETAVESYRLIVVSRDGFEAPRSSVYLVDGLRRNEANIHIIDDETFPNGLSSSRIRTAIRRGENVRYSLPDKVLSYIQHHRLYHTSSLQRRTHLREVEASFEATTASGPPAIPPRPLQTTHQPPIPPPPKRSTSVKPVPLPTVPPRMSQSLHCNLATHSAPSFGSPKPLRQANPTTADVWESSTCTQSQASSGSSSESPRQKNTRGNLSPTASAKTLTPEHNRMTQSLSEHGSPSARFSPSLTLGGAINVSRCEIPPKSPDYDNVTLDELLVASNSWAHYMNDQYRQIQCRPRMPKDRVISVKEEKAKTTSCSPTKGPKKLLKPFMRTGSKTSNQAASCEQACNCAELYEQDFYGYREMMRERKCDCGSYLAPGEDDPRLAPSQATRNHQRDTKPDAAQLQKLKMQQQRGILSDPAAAVESCNERKSSREQRSIRFATTMTKSMDSLPSMRVRQQNGTGEKMSQSTRAPDGGFASADDNQVTLSFTRYRLSATPETTV